MPANNGETSLPAAAQPADSDPPAVQHKDEVSPDPYLDYEPSGAGSPQGTTAVAPPAAAAPPPPPPAGGGGGGEEGHDDEEEDMLRMSFLEHLEELRSRLIKCIIGLLVAFAVSLTFAERLFLAIEQPAFKALRDLGYEKPELIQTSPMEAFSIIYMKLPLVAALFLASPWILYQVWAFIAPGLYKRERRWAAPFIICSAGLFILGGLFAYFVAFRFGLTFLLGIGRDIQIRPLVTISEYFNLFINVILGIGLVFELPVLIFFLTLVRLTTASFLLRHTRYAVLAIVVLAAIITPTPDVYNLVIFSVPMIALFFVGVFASYLLELHREQRRFPWHIVLIAGLMLLVIGVTVFYLAVHQGGYRIVPSWPFLVR